MGSCLHFQAYSVHHDLSGLSLSQASPGGHAGPNPKLTQEAFQANTTLPFSQTRQPSMNRGCLSQSPPWLALPPSWEIYPSRHPCIWERIALSKWLHQCTCKEKSPLGTPNGDTPVFVLIFFFILYVASFHFCVMLFMQQRILQLSNFLKTA